MPRPLGHFNLTLMHSWPFGDFLWSIGDIYIMDWHVMPDIVSIGCLDLLSRKAAMPVLTDRGAGRISL